jgi:acyl-coenzyme A synthetase/AMP-(fatty) acid ligase
MNSLPLLTERAAGDRIAQWRGAPVDTASFVAQAEQLARALPEASHCINLAENRYHFLLAWVAACLRGQVMLLPPNQLPAVLDELRREYPRHHVFDDAAAENLLESVAPVAEFSSPAVPIHWQLPADRVVAIVFTSGSTGKPQAHPKTWGSLFHNSRLAARDVLGGSHRQVVATVPSQHMYGLEASLLGALSAGCCIHDQKPFFPADVRAALEAMPEPRTLVTTPAHLKILTAAGIELPALHRVVSATAPLPTELAAQAESLWRTEVFEIFGCTEAGVMAHRRTTSGPRWRTLEGGTMVQADGAAEYRAPQLPAVTPLQDVIETHGDTEFVLLGRAADMIKVAGKRTSLQELTRQVSSVPGVEDAAVLLRDGEERPAAAVVAPGIDAPRLLAALRQIMEPVFVPRPLVVVNKLPRNELGKLPREALLNLFAAVDHSAVIRIPADHPSLAGHFPGNPLVPGVVLLDAVLAYIKERRLGVVQSLPSVKFLAPVRPGEEVQLRVEFDGTRARFIGRRDATPVLEGSVVLTEGDLP